MEAYADYNFYKDMYKGTAIPQSDFARLATQASFFVNRCCFNRIDEVILNDSEMSEKIKRATCAVAELSHKYEKYGDISSESVGKVSTTYNVKYKSIELGKTDAVNMYLKDTGLMYRGFYRNDNKR